MSALTIHTDHSLARFCSRPLLACASVWIFGITAMTCGSATREALVRLLLGYACLVLSLGIGAATADPITQRQDAANLARIRQLLAQPESQIDTARAELEIERMIDPSIDVDATLRKLDAMAASVQAVLPPKASTLGNS